MGTPYTVADFSRFAAGALAALSAESGLPLELDPYRFPIPDWEADAFLRGLDRGVFGVRPRLVGKGWSSTYVGSVMRLADGGLKNLHFLETLGRSPMARRVAREFVTEMATASRLVNEFGHDPDAIRAESAKSEIDVEVYDRDPVAPGARLMVGVEVKVDPAEHDALVAGLLACGGRGGAETHRQAFRDHNLRPDGDPTENHHHKCRWLATALPEVFWVVSPERWDAPPYAVSAAGPGAFALDERGLDALRWRSPQPSAHGI
jgi:hypothetical protein